MACTGNWLVVRDFMRRQFIVGFCMVVRLYRPFCHYNDRTLVSLVKIILNTRMELDDLPLKKIAFVWWPFCLYSGWITVALVADAAAWLTKIHWNGFGISGMAWAIIMIIVAGIINLIVTWNRNMREYALVGSWALIAIAVANRHEAAICCNYSNWSSCCTYNQQWYSCLYKSSNQSL